MFLKFIYVKMDGKARGPSLILGTLLHTASILVIEYLHTLNEAKLSGKPLRLKLLI